MMKKVVLLILVVVSTVCFSNAQGIKFQDCSYKEALEMAKQQNKLLFVGMSITGCGPCKLMQQRVFPLPEVGKVYNEKFVCWYVNCTKDADGEKLADDNGIKSYPSYVWLDPNTGKIVHHSGGSRRPKAFLELAKKPFNKDEASGYLLEQYSKGNRDLKFLAKLYSYYKFERKDEMLKVMEKELVEKYGDDFKYEPLADFYFENIFRRNSLMTQYMLKHKGKIMRKYGKERVMNKIANLK